MLMTGFGEGWAASSVMSKSSVAERVAGGDVAEADEGGDVAGGKHGQCPLRSACPG